MWEREIERKREHPPVFILFISVLWPKFAMLDFYRWIWVLFCSLEKKKTELYQELSLQARDLRFQHLTSITARNNAIIIRMEVWTHVITLGASEDCFINIKDDLYLMLNTKYNKYSKDENSFVFGNWIYIFLIIQSFFPLF